MPSDTCEIWLKCPKCGYTDTLDGFDVAGADHWKMFCGGCDCEIEPEDGVPPQTQVEMFERS